MEAIILAAGRPPMGEEPISNLPIRGERLLDVQLSVLRSIGAQSCALVAGYRAERISRPDTRIVVNRDWEKGGSLASLKRAAHLLDGSRDVVICYGDTIFDPHVLETLMRVEAGIAAVCFLDRTNRDIGRFREFAHIDGGRLVGVSASRDNDDVRTVFTGMLLVRRSKAAVVRRFLEQDTSDAMAHVGMLLDVIVRGGVEAAPVLIERGWFELATPTLVDEALREARFLDTVIQIHTDWAARAQRYDRLQWVNDDVLLSAVVRAALAERARAVLDLGTGSGKVLLALRQAIGEGEFWGVDLSPEMLGKISQKEGLVLRICNAETLQEIPAAHFDVVTARMVFHHLDDIARTMQSIVRVLRPGGRLVVCEGVPPSTRSLAWYTEMFRYKEDRRTLTEGDLIHAFVQADFEDIRTESVLLHDASLNNWLDNSGIPQRNIDVIKQMHYAAPAEVAQDYNMRAADGDCLMTWRFAVVSARSPLGAGRSREMGG